MPDVRHKLVDEGAPLDLFLLRQSEIEAHVPEALAQIDPAANQALAIPAIAVLEAAERAGVPGAATLKQKFAGASKVVGALTRKPPGRH